MPWACRTCARGRARREVSIQEGSRGPDRQGGSRPGPDVLVKKPPRTVTDSPTPARLRALLPFSPHCCLLASPQGGVPRGDFHQRPRGPQPGALQGSSGPRWEVDSGGDAEARGGGPRPWRAAPEQCACPRGPRPGRRRYQAGIGRNPSAPATSAGHSLRRGSTAGGRAAGGGHPVLSQAVPASRGSGSPQTFCVSGREGPVAASGIRTHPTCRVPWEAGVQFRSGGCPCAVQLGFEPRVWISPEAPTLPQHLRCGLRKSCPQGTGQGQASCHSLTRWEGQP